MTRNFAADSLQVQRQADGCSIVGCGGYGGSFEKTIVPAAANMPPTP
jgi:hypothetical protein